MSGKHHKVLPISDEHDVERPSSPGTIDTEENMGTSIIVSHYGVE